MSKGKKWIAHEVLSPGGRIWLVYGGFSLDGLSASIFLPLSWALERSPEDVSWCSCWKQRQKKRKRKEMVRVEKSTGWRKELDFQGTQNWAGILAEVLTSCATLTKWCRSGRACVLTPQVRWIRKAYLPQVLSDPMSKYLCRLPRCTVASEPPIILSPTVTHPSY